MVSNDIELVHMVLALQWGCKGSQLQTRSNRSKANFLAATPSIQPLSINSTIIRMMMMMMMMMVMMMMMMMMIKIIWETSNFLAVRPTIQPLSINDCQDEDNSLSFLGSMMRMVNIMTKIHAQKVYCVHVLRGREVKVTRSMANP